MKDIQIFQSEQFGSVRVLYEDGKPLFCGKDVCKALGYADATNSMKQHCHGVVKRHLIDSKGRCQQANFIHEGDLYRLITHSKLPSAEKFERWVFDEVLPTLRQTGQYGADPAELERLRRSNAVLRDWLDLLAARKRDLVELQQECEKVKRRRDDAKAYYLEAKANYSKWSDLVRTFENLTRQAQADINSYIDQIQIVALTTPVLDEELNAMLDDMACELLQAAHQKTTTCPVL